MTAKKGYEGCCPYGGMEGGGEVEGVLEDEKMFHRNGRTKGALVMSAIMLRSGTAHGTPIIVAIPWGTIDDVPGTDAGHPGFNRVAGNLTLVLTDEGAEEGPHGGHPVGLRDVPSIAKLGEAEDPSTISAFGVGGIK